MLKRSRPVNHTRKLFVAFAIIIGVSVVASRSVAEMLANRLHVSHRSLMTSQAEDFIMEPQRAESGFEEDATGAAGQQGNSQPEDPEQAARLAAEEAARQAEEAARQAAQQAEEESAQRAEAVRNAMRHAWRGYERYAMGAAELHPVKQEAKQDILGGAGISGLGVTVIDAMTTLHVMNLTNDFGRARDWVSGSLRFDRDGAVSFFETVIRLLGGLMSCYDLSGDDMFLKKAKDLADRLLPNFQPGSGLPASIVYLNQGSSAGAGGSSLAEIGTNMLEFGSLALRTGQVKYLDAAEKGIRRLHRCYPNALLARDIDTTNGRPTGTTYTLGAGADSYFEYLLKYWILTGKQDEHWRQRWVAAADEIMQKLVPKIEGDPSISFTSELNGESLENTVDHLSCFWPGNVALGVMHGAVRGIKAELYLRFAEGMAKACYLLYNATTTGLGAERIVFDPATGVPTVIANMFWQRPEVIESIFYVYRATKDPMYREWGWRMFQAFEKHCRQAAGYTGVVDVMQDPPQLDDAQQSWLLAETFKYYFLLFAPDSAWSLEEWVFNTEAHPLRALRPSDAKGQRFLNQDLGEEGEEGGAGQGQGQGQEGGGASGGQPGVKGADGLDLCDWEIAQQQQSQQSCDCQQQQQQAGESQQQAGEQQQQEQGQSDEAAQQREQAGEADQQQQQLDESQQQQQEQQAEGQEGGSQEGGSGAVEGEGENAGGGENAGVGEQNGGQQQEQQQGQQAESSEVVSAALEAAASQGGVTDAELAKLRDVQRMEQMMRERFQRELVRLRTRIPNKLQHLEQQLQAQGLQQQGQQSSEVVSATLEAAASQGGVTDAELSQLRDVQRMEQMMRERFQRELVRLRTRIPNKLQHLEQQLQAQQPRMQQGGKSSGGEARQQQQ